MKTELLNSLKTAVCIVVAVMLPVLFVIGVLILLVTCAGCSSVSPSPRRHVAPSHSESTQVMR